jgi:hypothetical protein
MIVGTSPVAQSVPMDNLPSFYSGTSVQEAFDELRKRSMLIPQSNTITLNGTLTLTSSSNALQFFSGTASGYSVVLPAANTIKIGELIILANSGNSTIQVKDGSGANLFTLSQNSIAYCYLRVDSTVAGTWLYYQVLASSTASGIVNYTLDDATPFVNSTTRFPNYVQITGFSITPQAGTYAVWYNATVFYTTTPKAHYWAFYKGGVREAGSVRSQDTAHSNQTMVDSSIDVLSFDGATALDVRVSCDNTGTLTVNSRTLILIRLGT